MNINILKWLYSSKTWDLNYFIFGLHILYLCEQYDNANLIFPAPYIYSCDIKRLIKTFSYESKLQLKISKVISCPLTTLSHVWEKTTVTYASKFKLLPLPPSHKAYFIICCSTSQLSSNLQKIHEGSLWMFYFNIMLLQILESFLELRCDSLHRLGLIDQQQDDNQLIFSPYIVCQIRYVYIHFPCNKQISWFVFLPPVKFKASSMKNWFL